MHIHREVNVILVLLIEKININTIFFRMHPLLCLNGILLVCLKKTKYHQLCLSEMFKRN